MLLFANKPIEAVKDFKDGSFTIAQKSLNEWLKLNSEYEGKYHIINPAT